MTKNLDRASLKTLIVSLLKSDDELCVEVFHDITESNPELLKSNKTEKRKKLEQIIKEDFEEYDEVFKALA
jgi:hypothetical protein